MKFIERISGMITKPDETTKDIVNEPRIEEGLLIVGIYMILLIIGAYLTFSRISYTGELQGISASTVATIALISGLAVVIVESLIGWPILTGVVHLMSMFFGGAGKLYPHMMSLIGYTALPLIVVAIISILLSIIIPGDVTTIDISGTTQVSTQNALNNPVTIIGLIVTLAGSLWTAYLMAFAVKNGEKISMNNAYVVVGVLFIVNLVLTFGSVIFALLR
jgi:hypothetical protein